MLRHEEHERHFLQRARQVADHLRLPKGLVPRVAEHLHQFAHGRAPVIWLQGQNCTGCSVALLNSEHFSPVNLGVDNVSLLYQPNLTGGEGDGALALLEKVGAEMPGGFLMVLEGAIPVGSKEHFCGFGLSEREVSRQGRKVRAERSVFQLVQELLPSAFAVVCVGNCASFGGIPAGLSDVTGATAAAEVVRGLDGSKPVLNVAGCPPHPDWLMDTIVDGLLCMTDGKPLPETDERGCIREFFASTIHENCERLSAFKEKRFLTDWNEPEGDEPPCLLKMGCRGSKTRGDCPVRRWNNGVNWCVGASAPCHGCTNEDFQDRLPHPSG